MSPQNASLELNAQYLKDFSFENPQSPASLINMAEAPQVQIDVAVQASRLDSVTNPNGAPVNPYEVTLTIRATAKNSAATLFVLDLTYAGIFTSSAEDPAELQPLLLIEAPRLLFPFARAIAANTTREGGFPPLLINPVDFETLYRQNAESGKAA